MDLPMWFFPVAVLLAAVHADPADQGPQVFSDPNEPSPSPTKVKREPQYEMKEVILYLTPSQIKAVEAGLIQPQQLMHTQIHPQPRLMTTPKPRLPSLTDEIQKQMQKMKNILNDAGQKIQKEVKKIESNKKQRVQQESTELNVNKHQEQLQKITPELNAPQLPQLDLQKREKFMNLPLQVQLIEQSQRHEASNLEQHLIPPNLDKLIAAGDAGYNVGRGHQTTQTPLAHLQFQEPQLHQISPYQEKSQGWPQNYAYLYFYPKGKPVDSNQYQLYYPNLQQQQQKALAQQSDHNLKEQQVHIPQASSSQEVQGQRELQSQLGNQQKELQFQLDHRQQEYSHQDQQGQIESLSQLSNQQNQLHFQLQHKPREYSSQEQQGQRELLSQLGNQQKDLNFQLEHRPQEYSSQEHQGQRESLSQLGNQQNQLHFQLQHRPQDYSSQEQQGQREVLSQLGDQQQSLHFQLEHRPQEYSSLEQQGHRELLSQLGNQQKELNFQLEHRPQESLLQEEHEQRELLPQLGNQHKELHFQLEHRPQELILQQDQGPKELFLHAEHKPRELIFYPNANLKELLLQQQHSNQPLSVHPEHNIFLQADPLPKELFLHEDQKLKTLRIQPEHDFKDLFLQPQFHHLPKFNPQIELFPYQYALQNKLEAQQLLQAQLSEHGFNSHRLHAQKLEPHHLEDITTHHFPNQKELSPKYQTHHSQVSHHEKPPTLKAILKVGQLKESDIKKFHPHFQKELKEVMVAQKVKAKIQKEEQEAHRLDSELEEEQEKAERFKAEQLKEQLEKNKQVSSEYLPPPTSLDILMKIEPKRSRTHSTLKPLFQGHNIAESLQEQRANFPHHKVQMETGFIPLQYAPKYYGEEYARQLENLERRNRMVKQQALVQAAAMSNEPLEIIKRLEDKAVSIEVVKHVKVPIPTPVMVPVPAPFEVKVPQPYPVPLEVFRPVPVPIVKMEKVEVEKPVPIEVEKRVPVPVTKNVYVKVDKPYYVEKVVPVEVKKEIPVEIPRRNTQKLSIIRHVWES